MRILMNVDGGAVVFASTDELSLFGAAQPMEGHDYQAQVAVAIADAKAAISKLAGSAAVAVATALGK